MSSTSTTTKVKSKPKSPIFPSLIKGKEANLNHIAELIKDGKVKNIVIMAGAGISTAAGIPDFRSPETGLYSNLEKYKLPYPEAIFDIEYFLKYPSAFYTLAKELYPGNFKPTLTHYFFTLLKKKGLLTAVFTQNIDTLERIAGLNDESVIEAHGSFAEAECLNCKKSYTKEEIKPQIELGEIVRCERLGCKGKFGALIKPKIVFFGESLPERFYQRLPDFHISDLLIVLGTSLSVQPFASLIDRVPIHCPRLLINKESVGESNSSKYSTSKHHQDEEGEEEEEGFNFTGNGLEGGRGGGRGIRDVKYLGSSDEGLLKLCTLLGWEKELIELEKIGNSKLDEEEKKNRVLVEEGERVEVVEEVIIVKVIVGDGIEKEEEEVELVELVEGLKLVGEVEVEGGKL